jgi:prepilin-type N-terminal cleavage/methylation domain-containing protein
MRSAHQTPSSPRRGLTLVELLVVIAIAVGLAGLAVLVFPRLQDSQRSAKGADIVQGQLFIAKQMALRDQQPRGIRLLSTGTFFIPVVVNGVTVNVPQFDQLQLIEQPPAYTNGVVQNPAVVPNAQWPVDPNNGWFIVTFLPDPTSGATADFSTGAVLPGDLLDLSAANDSYTVNAPGGMHIIMKVQAATATTPPMVWVLTQPQISYTGSPLPFYYRIIRSPRPLTGQKPVSLPNGIVVDAASTSLAYAGKKPVVGSLITADTDGNFDFLFDPSGKMLRASGTQGKAVLWVKDVSGNAFDADQTLVAIYTRTGLITAQPVNLNPAIGPPNLYYYAFVTDGATSGM